MNQGESKAEIPFKQGELFNPEDYAGDLLLTQEQFNFATRGQGMLYRRAAKKEASQNIPACCGMPQRWN